MKSNRPNKVVVTYGRFNPPHKGHELIYNRMLAYHDAERYIMLSPTHDNKKNPLSAEDKLEFCKKLFPAANVQLIKGGYVNVLKTIPSSKLLIIVVGDDRIQDIQRIVDKYNHVEFDFDKVEIVSAGKRQGAISASQMREFVLNRDYPSFEKYCSDKLSDHDKRRLYDLVARGLQ